MSMDYDIVVVGGGHAGCEAAGVAARMGRRVALVTLELDKIGRLSCNPAVGGLAKGHLVRELDALGGLMARVTDVSSIQFRRLNTRKGLAVQSSRAQVDIDVYPKTMQAELTAIDTLDLVEGEVVGIPIEGGRVQGVTLSGDRRLTAPRVILTSGTFLSAILHRGEEQTVGGRIGDGASHALADSLKEAGLRLGRLKTGTVPRLDGRTIDWDRLEVQEDTVPDGRFSFAACPSQLTQIDCHLTYTNEAVHRCIRDNVDRSPMFLGTITGAGPRYCPSIEDKVTRFPDRDRHLLFLEPEGLSTDRVYVNGLATSLPSEVQDDIIHAIEGLEDATILQYGYAVEYDYADPRDLGHDLQHKDLRGLYLAGQVNGTSGYEEAAVQGFVAGVSAAQGSTFELARQEAYIGVLIDDLVTRGVGGEPYRMFTSRAEHRLILREDNADRRLMEKGRSLGLIDDSTWNEFVARRDLIEGALKQAREARVVPSPVVIEQLEAHGLGGLKKPVAASEILRRPDARWTHMVALFGFDELPPDAAERVEIEIKYEGYIARAKRRSEAAVRMESLKLDPSLDWSELSFLSTEVRERLARARPETLGQMGRLPGITPAAVNAVAAWIGSKRRPRRA